MEKFENDNPKANVETTISSIDINKNKKIEASETKNFDVEAKKQLEILRAMAESPDPFKKEALNKAVIEVTAQYEGVSPSDVFEWINGKSILSKIDVVNIFRRKEDKHTKPPYGISAIKSMDDFFSPQKQLGVYNQQIALSLELDFAILDHRQIDNQALTHDQKIFYLLNLGKRGVEAYDVARRDNHYSAKIVSADEFFKNLSRKSYFYQMANMEARGPDAKDASGQEKMLEKLSKEFDIDVKVLRKEWHDRKDITDFIEKIENDYFKSGVCRDVAVIQARIANDLQLPDTFSTSVSSGGKAHSLAGFRNTDGNITFINWDTLIETNTPNMKLALRYLERYLGSVALNYLQSKGGDNGNNLLRMKSAASESLETIARGTPKKPDKIVDEDMSRGGLEPRAEGAQFTIEKDRTIVELRTNQLGGSMILTSMLMTPQTAENSIEKAQSLRIAQEYGGDHVKVGLGGALAHLTLKNDKLTNKAEMSRFFVDLYAKTHGTVHITQNIKYQIGVMVDAIVDCAIDKELAFSSAEMEAATAQQLSFMSRNFELYVGLKTIHSLVPKNIQAANVNAGSYKIVNDVIAENVGADIQMGTFAGHKVHINPQIQTASSYAGLAKEYEGSMKVDMQRPDSTLYIRANAKKIESNDFRVPESVNEELSVGYTKTQGSKLLQIRGYMFKDVSLGELKDPRLDNLGAGFQISYLF